MANTKTDSKNEERSMRKFCHEVFPNIRENINTPGWLEGRTILSPTNKEVDAINNMMEECWNFHFGSCSEFLFLFGYKCDEKKTMTRLSCFNVKTKLL